MKQNILKSLLLALLVAMLPQVASAYDFMVDGLCYNYNSDGTSVTLTYEGTGDEGYGYSNLNGDLVIPPSVTYDGTTYSVTTIGGRAFYGCSGLTSVTIPNSVTTIGYEAFAGCTGLTSVTIPNLVTTIGDHAFYGCTGLTSVIIPNSVTSIGESAFGGCTGLTEVTIGNSVTTINYAAFYGCTGLTSVTIPNSVTTIGYGAFYGCTGLTSIKSKVLNPDKVSMYSSVFYKVDKSNCTLYVPQGTKDVYQATPQWSDFVNIVEVPFAPGDVNYDDECTGSDVTALYNFILYNDSSAIVNGDQNGDGVVTGSDVTAVYNIILGL
ncbi:MAG: leucine-rich repeat protein [Muribaculaceae bacterium]|nr:leucine-rich repeat protein [Muribaculaceae bacterium]